MARPKKQPHEKRDGPPVGFRATLAEREFLATQAAAAGMTVSDYLRRRALGQKVSPAPARVDAQLVSEINRLGMELKSWGVNLNQLTRDENSGREFHGDWVALRDRLNYELDEVERVLSQVAAGYGS